MYYIMFYCPNCNNTYDIARSSAQVGGRGRKTIDETSDADMEPIHSTTTQSNVENESSQQMGGVNVPDMINKVLNNQQLLNEDVKGLNMDNVIKHPEYKKLNQEDKEKVYNKLQDFVPKHDKKLMETKPAEPTEENLAFFVCSNCSYSVKIDDGTRIFSRTSSDISQSYTTGDYSDMLYSNILPRTRRYTCPNKKCESYTNPAKRQAVFFRKNNSYEVMYICSACETAF
jgi:hypothetical protein